MVPAYLFILQKKKGNKQSYFIYLSMLQGNCHSMSTRKLLRAGAPIQRRTQNSMMQGNWADDVGEEGDVSLPGDIGAGLKGEGGDDGSSDEGACEEVADLV